MRWKAKQHEREDIWKRWFAWYPVEIDGHWVWFEWVERWKVFKGYFTELDYRHIEPGSTK